MARRIDYSKILATWWTGIIYHKEQLDMLISLQDVVSYSYILHDKDIADDGKPKKPHYHFLVKLSKNQRGSWFKMLATDDMGQVFPEAVGNPQEIYNYLIHDTERARKEGKYLYPENERVGIIEDFVPDEKVKASDEVLEDIIKITNGQMTWTELFKKKSETIYNFKSLYAAAKQIFADMYGIDIDPFEQHMKIKN